MRYFLFRILWVVITALLIQLFFPWWMILAGCFVIGFANGNAEGNPFLAGFLGVFLLWSAYAGIIDYETQSIISVKIMNLFHLPESSFPAIILTGLLGGIPGGLACKTGSELRKLLKNTRNKK